MTIYFFLNARRSNCATDGDLHNVIVKMMAASFAQMGVNRTFGRWEYILPFPFTIRIRVFPFEGVWE